VNAKVKISPEVAQTFRRRSYRECYNPDWAYINTIVDKWIDRATRELGKW
jgi:hypothetical protein